MPIRKPAVRKDGLGMKFAMKFGACGEVDLADELEGPVFGPLRDLDRFQRFTLACHTLTWENGADFAAEFPREHVRVTA